MLVVVAVFFIIMVRRRLRRTTIITTVNELLLNRLMAVFFIGKRTDKNPGTGQKAPGNICAVETGHHDNVQAHCTAHKDAENCA